MLPAAPAGLRTEPGEVPDALVTRPAVAVGPAVARQIEDPEAVDGLEVRDLGPNRVPGERDLRQQ